MLLSAVFALATVGLPVVARATCAILPYTFTNNVSTIDAATTNANNTTLYSCVTNIDWTQIGTAGIYPSQLIPITTAQATFGGLAGVTYTFPGPLRVQTASAWVPPVYTASGVATSASEHIVRGTVSFVVPSSYGSQVATVTLSGAAVFINATTYEVISTINGVGTSLPTAWSGATGTAYRTSGTSFNVGCAGPGPIGTGGPWTCAVDYIAIGY